MLHPQPWVGGNCIPGGLKTYKRWGGGDWDTPRHPAPPPPSSWGALYCLANRLKAPLLQLWAGWGRAGSSGLPVPPRPWHRRSAPAQVALRHSSRPGGAD